MAPLNVIEHGINTEPIRKMVDFHIKVMFEEAQWGREDDDKSKQNWFDPAIPLLGIYIEETRSERDTCTPVFIAALFIIARTWKQPRCPSADEWIRKRWYIYTMEYCSAIKKNSFESVLMSWMKLEPIIDSEVSQKGKEHYSILTHIYGI